MISLGKNEKNVLSTSLLSHNQGPSSLAMATQMKQVGKQFNSLELNSIDAVRQNDSANQNESEADGNTFIVEQPLSSSIL